ncbi:autophagy protein 6, partial [Dinochytrium kinnereticum]
MEKRVSELRKERESYASFLKSLEEVDATENAESVLAELEGLKEREESALRVLRDLEAEANSLNEELKSVENELKDLDDAEISYWHDVNRLQSQLGSYENERDSITLKFDYASSQLEKLKKTNVYNDTFRIWHDGPFGTINGFRMGRLPTTSVDWTEINAAMGQSLLLLDTLATKLGFVFKTYRLVPMGNFSRIEKVDGDKAVYELYGTGDLAGILFWNRRFDNALVAFLNCLQQLGDFAEQKDPKFRLPYR